MVVGGLCGVPASPAIAGQRTYRLTRLIALLTQALLARIVRRVPCSLHPPSIMRPSIMRPRLLALPPLAQRRAGDAEDGAARLPP